MSNADKAMDLMQLALDAALEQLLSAQKAAEMINSARMEERDISDDEMDVAQTARKEAVANFMRKAGII